MTDHTSQQNQLLPGSGIVRALVPEEGVGADAGPNTTIVDGPGPVLTHVHVELIFWGSTWAMNPTPSVASITNAVTSILSGPYMTMLSQYHDIGRGKLVGSAVVTNSSPQSTFSEQNVQDFIRSLIQSGTVPAPTSDSQLYYCVIMPPGVTSNTSPNFVGEHSFFSFNNTNVHYAWVTNDGALNNFNSVPRIFSHELVEACSDPEGTAIQISPANPTSWNEIGDACNSTTFLDGVLVQSYWSQIDRACIIPTGPRWKDVVDVTAITGQTIASPLTSWQTPNGPFNVEHLAGMSPNGDVLVFYWSPQHDWQVVNVSQITKQQIAGPLTSWQTPNGPFNVEHLAGMSPNGDVLVFYWSPQHDWQVVNVSQIAGAKVAGPLTSWQTPNGPFNVEHLAGMSPNGDVLVFYWSPQHDWQVVNVSQIAGAKVAGPLTSWQTPDGPFNVEHLAGMSPTGDVLVFYWSPQHDWQVVNVSQIAGAKVASSLTSWQTPNGPFNVEHLAGMSPNGDVLVFYWSPRNDWQVVNVSQISRQQIAGPLTSWQTHEGPFNVEHLAGVGTNGDLLIFFWSPEHDWQVVDVSQSSGQQIVNTPTSWQTPDGQYNVEHLAGQNPNGDVLVFFRRALPD